MPDTPQALSPATSLSEVVGVPKSFRKICLQQAIVTVGQACELCRNLDDDAELRTALAISVADLDQIIALLPPQNNEGAARMTALADIPAGVLPLSFLPEDHPLCGETGKEETDEPPDGTEEPQS